MRCLFTVACVPRGGRLRQGNFNKVRFFQLDLQCLRPQQGSNEQLITSNKRVWSSLAAYVLIKALGLIQKEPRAIADRSPPSQQFDGSAPPARDVSEKGLSGWWGLLRDAALRWIDHKAEGWVPPWHITRSFRSAR